MDQRDFSTVSPSARGLLLLKGFTNIPFARRAAELASYPDAYIPDFTIQEPGFWASVVHFESRYWSIDQLLNELPARNVLEISSGFSFRGLEMTAQENIHYIDTDLPGVIDTKNNFIDSLLENHPGRKNRLELLPLNVLEEERFGEIIDHFPPGEIVIVNEGLLMYLDQPEKEKLCGIIHKILEKRGGYWITADIYIKNKKDDQSAVRDPKWKEFFEQHRVEEKKFNSFEEAEMFFTRMGFVIDKEAQPDRSKITSLSYLMENSTEEQKEKFRNTPKIRATWRLRIA